MPQSFDQTDRDSWKDSCLLWALGLAGRTILAGLLLVGLISILPSLEITRDSVRLEHDGTHPAQWCYVQNMRETSDQRSMWVSRHSRATEKVDLTTGLRLEELHLPSGYLSGIQLNQAGTRILFIASDGQLTAGRRDPHDWELLPVRSTRGEVDQYALSPVTDLLAIATADSVEVWAFKDLPQPLAMIPLSCRVAKMEWSPDGCHLLILTNNGVLEIRHGETLAAMRSAQTSVRGDACCFWSLDGRHVVATNKKGTLTVWALEETEDALRQIECQPHPVVAMSHDGRWLAVPDMSRRVWLINVADPDDRYELGSLTAHPCAVRFAADGSFLLVGLADGSLQCWSLADRQLAWISSDTDGEKSSFRNGMSG